MQCDDFAERLVESRSEDGYVFPDYGGYCFAGVSGTCLSVLDRAPPDVPTLPEDVFAGIDIAGIDTVLYVLLDGLGYDQWRRAEDDQSLDTGLLERVREAGRVTPLTSTYPSETGAAIPTSHTGQYPREHGLLGWWQYVESIDTAVQTLPYTTRSDDPVREVYPDVGYPGEELYDAQPIYGRVPDGLDIRLFEPDGISGPEGAAAFTAGADEYVPHEDVSELVVQLRRAIAGASEPSYYYAYVPEIDKYNHEHGVDSVETNAQIESVLESLEHELLEQLDPEVAERTLLVLSADHGHVDTKGDNIDTRDFDPVWDNLERGDDGEPIPPLGSARNVQLHLQQGTVERVATALETEFDCRTFTHEEYERRELFGPGDPGRAFEAHAPDLLCVHRKKGMWYTDEALEHHGMHGGLTREEMVVPFGTARLGELQ